MNIISFVKLQNDVVCLFVSKTVAYLQKKKKPAEQGYMHYDRQRKISLRERMVRGETELKEKTQKRHRDARNKAIEREDAACIKEEKLHKISCLTGQSIYRSIMWSLLLI